MHSLLLLLNDTNSNIPHLLDSKYANHEPLPLLLLAIAVPLWKIAIILVNWLFYLPNGVLSITIARLLRNMLMVVYSTYYHYSSALQ